MHNEAINIQGTRKYIGVTAVKPKGMLNIWRPEFPDTLMDPPKATCELLHQHR